MRERERERMWLWLNKYWHFKTSRDFWDCIYVFIFLSFNMLEYSQVEIQFMSSPFWIVCFGILNMGKKMKNSTFKAIVCIFFFQKTLHFNFLGSTEVSGTSFQAMMMLGNMVRSTLQDSCPLIWSKAPANLTGLLKSLSKIWMDHVGLGLGYGLPAGDSSHPRPVCPWVCPPPQSVSFRNSPMLALLRLGRA